MKLLNLLMVKWSGRLVKQKDKQSLRETSSPAGYPKYNHGNEKYNEDDSQDNQEGVDLMLEDFFSSKLVDFFSSSQRRNTDSLQHKGLK